VTDPDETIRRGQRAEQILNDDVFKSAIAAMKAAALESLKSAPLDRDALLAARIYIDAVDWFERYIGNVMRDGSFEKRKKDMAKPPVKPEDRFTPRHGFPQ
jgi:hypothetical protein